MEDFAMVRRGPFGAATVTAAVVTVLALALAGCAPGVQPLLDDYNALFGSVTERGQEGAQEDRVQWQSIYKLPSHYTLNLHAPAHCNNYKWELRPDTEFPDEQTKLPDGFDINVYLDTNRSWLRLDLAKAGFKAGSSYILSCETEKDGKTKTYRCTIVIEK